MSFESDLAAASEDYDPAAFDLLVELEESSFWFKGRNRLIQFTLRRHFPAARSLLEIGCGTGYVLAGLHASDPGLELSAAEQHPRGLAYALARVPTAHLYRLDARRLPFREEFDVICAFDVLEHVEEDEEVLREMWAGCRPGGGVLITVPQHMWLWSGADDYAHHKRRYQRSELMGKVRRAGFTVERVTSFVSLLLPLMAAGRLRPGARESFDLEREHAAAARIEPLLSRALKIELALIRRGLSLPAGGSLMLAAKRC